MNDIALGGKWADKCVKKDEIVPLFERGKELGFEMIVSTSISRTTYDTLLLLLPSNDLLFPYSSILPLSNMTRFALL